MSKAAAAGDPQGAAGTMTLLEHLKELRSRLVKSCAAVVVGLLAGFWLLSNSNLIDQIILRFVGTGGVQIVRVTEAFTSFIGVALMLGIILAMPVIVYQILAFLTPGLTTKEKRWVFIGMPLVLVFFAAGLAFGWFITVPAAMKFLVGFGVNVAPTLIENKPTLDDFLDLLIRLLLVNGIIFEMPMLMFTLAKLGILKPRAVARYRRYIILAVVVVAAIITPTGDPANLALTALPMYLLFEFGLLLGLLA
ncbi:MAG TPA: twin-arginine translocase subunit TatC [Herpetosiphonaceae bacterium]